MVRYCSNCGMQLIEGAAFCSKCGAKIDQQTSPIVQQYPTTQAQPIQPVQQPQTAQIQPESTFVPQQQTPLTQGYSSIWYQNHYRIRKKVLAIGNKYWIEDYNGNIIGFTKQKVFKLKEDIRIYTDESMTSELFRIMQEQILDVWGTFAIIDSQTNQAIGYIKRGFLSEFGRDAWELQNINRIPFGRIFEKSLGRALARKYLPGGGLVPEKMTVELNNQPIAEVNQDFKIIGDIWDLNCVAVPPDLDRRVLLACIILMGCIERDRK